MGWTGTLARGVDNCARSLPLCASLPTYIGGKIVWLPRQNWESVYKFYKPHLYRTLRDVLTRGSVFWDIGANVGLVSLFADKLVGKNGKVFAFEPAPERFARLSLNLMHARTVRPINCGVSDVDGEATVAQGTSSFASFIRDTAVHDTRYDEGISITDERVYVRTIDSLAAKVGAPDVIHIDAGGCELKIICGGDNTLANRHPTIIVEVHPWQLEKSGGSERKLFDALSSNSYWSDVIDRNPNGIYTVLAR